MLYKPICLAFALQVGDEMVRRSKLNLVDLAGSERVTKSNLDGTVLREAKYINLSLHYLEQVIIALQVGLDSNVTGCRLPQDLELWLNCCACVIFAANCCMLAAGQRFSS